MCRFDFLMYTLAEMGILWWFCQLSRPRTGSSSSCVFLIYLFSIFLAVLSLHCSAHAFSGRRDWGPYSSLSTLLIVVASLIAEHTL